MSGKGEHRQYERRQVRRKLNRSTDPGRVVRGYGGVLKTASSSDDNELVQLARNFMDHDDPFCP